MALPELASFAGVLGLIGVVVGAGLQAWLQRRAAREARLAAAQDSARSAAREAVAALLATSDITRGLYESVWQLDRNARQPPPEQAFERAVRAWADYQHALARVRVTAPAVYPATQELGAVLEEEIAEIEFVYQRAPDAKRMTQEKVNDYAERVRQAHREIMATVDDSAPLPANSGQRPH